VRVTQRWSTINPEKRGASRNRQFALRYDVSDVLSHSRSGEREFPLLIETLSETLRKLQLTWDGDSVRSAHRYFHFSSRFRRVVRGQRRNKGSVKEM